MNVSYVSDVKKIKRLKFARSLYGEKYNLDKINVAPQPLVSG